MLKLVKLVFLVSLFITSYCSNAGIIEPQSEDLTQDQYVTFGGYDWTWASTFNVQFYFCNPSSDVGFTNYDDLLTTVSSGEACKADTANQLMAASFHQGWSFYEDIAELYTAETSIDSYLTNYAAAKGLTNAQLFTRNNDIVNSFSYWNTSSDKTSAFDNPFASKWTDKGRTAVFPFFDNAVYQNTIYVRKSKPVPEPSTILIFGLALIGLSSKLRKR